MTAFPTRGQKAPNFWDQQLKNYINERSGSLLTIVEAGQTVDLNNAVDPEALLGYRLRGTATIEGIPLPAGIYVFQRNTEADSGWDYWEVVAPAELPAPSVDPDPGGGGTSEVTPQQPTWNDSLRNYVIANTTGVQYKKGGTNIAAGTYSTTSPTAAETVTITAVPKTGYTFPTGVATSWSHDYPVVSSWTNSFADTLLSPTGAVTSRTGWTITNAGDTYDAITIDGAGVYLTGLTQLQKTNPTEALKHFIELDYDLSDAATGSARFYVDVARAYQPHRHILRRFSSTAVQLELWYHSTLGGGDTIYVNTLPLAGKFRAESDGLYVYSYLDGTKITEAPHDGSLLGGGSPTASQLVINGEANATTKTRAKNVVMGTKA